MKHSVSQFIAYTLTLCLLTTFSACDTGQFVSAELENEDASLRVDTTDPLVQLLIEYGFRKDMIVDQGEHFVVEGDIVIWKRNLEQELAYHQAVPDTALSKTQQWVTNNVVSWSNSGNIVVRIWSTLNGTGWDTATLDAMDHWTDISNSKITFVPFDGSTGADITVVSASLATCTLANTDFPSGGNPGSGIAIDLGYRTQGQQCNSGPAPSASSREHNMVHELGHAIGFRHTNWQSRNEDENPLGANQIMSTPSTEGGSVMNGDTANNNWAGFTNHDRNTARALYPNGLAGIITDVNDDGPYGEEEIYVIYSATGGRPAFATLQKKSGSSWITAPGWVCSVSECSVYDTLWNYYGVQVRVKMENFAGDNVGYTPAVTLYPWL